MTNQGSCNVEKNVVACTEMSKKRKFENAFAVDELRASRKRNGKTEYLVKWSGFDDKDNSWEPEENIHGPKLIPHLKDRMDGRRVWQYYVDKPIDDKKIGWHDFADDEGVSITQLYQAWLDDEKAPSKVPFERTVVTKSGKTNTFKYTLDFETLTQRNETHVQHNVRALRWL
jgi:hypothetical protein